MPAADKHKKKRKKLCTQRIHGIQKWSASNVPKQMAETNFSLFADSCATSCNKKSMNQGQSIYSNNKEREICHFPTPLFFFMKTCLFSLAWGELGVVQSHMHVNTVTLFLKKRKKEKWNPGKMLAHPPPEEKASDYDKLNTLSNRIFHLCKTDKEEKT